MRSLILNFRFLDTSCLPSLSQRSQVLYQRFTHFRTFLWWCPRGRVQVVIVLLVSYCFNQIHLTKKPSHGCIWMWRTNDLDFDDCSTLFSTWEQNVEWFFRMSWCIKAVHKMKFENEIQFWILSQVVYHAMLIVNNTL